MKIKLLRVLCCPSCQAKLKLIGAPESEPEAEIEVGTLECSGCLTRYQIERGIPTLLVNPQQASREYQNFTFQWQLRFSGRAEPQNLLWGKDNSSLPYKVRKSGTWYLDCGCGSGEIIRGVALNNPTIEAIGMDVSESIRYAHERDHEIPNLHYVQGDILHPPLKDGSFQFILSLGVLHHTSDAREALRKSVALLQAGGFLSVWLYPDLDDLKDGADSKQFRKWKRYYFFRDSLFFRRGHLLNHRLLLKLCQLISLSISPFQHLLGDTSLDFKDRYRSNTFILFDNIAATYQHRPKKENVIAWLRDFGLTKILHSFERGGRYTATLRKSFDGSEGTAGIVGSLRQKQH